MGGAKIGNSELHKGGVLVTFLSLQPKQLQRNLRYLSCCMVLSASVDLLAVSGAQGRVTSLEWEGCPICSMYGTIPIYVICLQDLACT